MERNIVLIFLFLLMFVGTKALKSWAVTVAFWLLLFGVFCNQVVITVNGGRMPVFLENSILPENSTFLGQSPTHQMGDEHTKLKFLSDTIYIKPLDSVVSVGDIALCLAVLLPMVWCVVSLCVRRVRFFEKKLTVSFPVAFFAMVTSLLVLSVTCYL